MPQYADSYRVRVFALVPLCAAAFALSAMVDATPSDAYSLVYCLNVNLSGGESCGGPRHTLSANDAWSDTINHSTEGTVCATAFNTDGSQAGSWVCAWDHVSHSYCACALRYPYVGNGDPWYYSDYIYGVEYY